MIKVVFKNKETEIFDGDSAENDKFGAFIIMKKQGQEVGLIAISEIKALFVDGELEEDEDREKVELMSIIKTENGKRIVEHMRGKFKETLKDIDMMIEFNVRNVVINMDEINTWETSSYRDGYKNAMRDMRKELKGIHIL